ncbi:DUF4367 domain-containing protein [Paenibacillus sp. CN-4]|uniref:DUF4367 domain-containing protein n=1 Tax=Paenibacillus nanchangensis TaxID=3348343 RepID=UPI00397C6347
MRELQHDREEQGLKEMSHLSGNSLRVQTFDVSAQVMERVYRQAGVKPGRKTAAAAGRFRKGFALPAMAAVFVLCASVTGYAASQYLEFRNSQGDIVMDTAVAPKETDASKMYSQAYWQQHETAKSRLQPGEYGAYYVKNSTDPGRNIQYVYHENELDSIAGLQREIERTGAPSPSLPEHPLKEYTFDFGYVTPVHAAGLDSAAQETLKKRLIAEAEAAPQEEGLFVSKLDWSTSDFTFVRYSSGRHYVNLTVSRIEPDVTKTTIMQNEQDAAEKLSIGGTEAYYIRSGGPDGPVNAGTNRLGWIDETRALQFNLSDDSDSPLSKADLVKMAETWIDPK